MTARADRPRDDRQQPGAVGRDTPTTRRPLGRPSRSRAGGPARRCGASRRRSLGRRGHLRGGRRPWPCVPASACAAPACAGRLGPDERLVVLAPDERLDAVERDVVVDLLGRALHEVARRRDERALQAAVEAQLQAADRVGDDAGAVGAVPDLELELGVERHVTEGRALHPDVAPLAVLQPRHVVARADVDVVRVDLVVEHRGDGVGLARSSWTRGARARAC